MLFKNRYVDFVVEENLPFTLSKDHKSDTPWLYIKIEKRNLNTMDVVKQVMKKFSLPRKKIGIAWLKDKHALARQRLCFHTNDVAKIGDQQFLKLLQEITKVVDYGFAKMALNLSTEITNTFWIRLRKDPKNREKKAVLQSLNDPRNKRKGSIDASAIKGANITKDELETRLKKLYTQGFLNLYGEQRFGFTHANHRIAQEIIEGKKKNLDNTEIAFKLQSLASWLFNNYCTYRESKYGTKILDGDIFTTEGSKTNETQVPTWPIFGDDLTRADPTTESGKLELEWKNHFELDEKILEAFRKTGLFWRRRAIRVKPSKASHSWQGEDLLLQFTLPKGSYASVLVEELLGELD